jgi:hypothetical protein
MMDRRKFLARVGQLMAGATIATTVPKELLPDGPRVMDYFPAANVPYRVYPDVDLSQLEADLETLWAKYEATPSAIWVSSDVYEELKDLAGFYEATPGTFDSFSFQGIKVTENKHAPAGTSGPMSMNKFLTARSADEGTSAPLTPRLTPTASLSAATFGEEA